MNEEMALEASIAEYVSIVYEFVYTLLTIAVKRLLLFFGFFVFNCYLSTCSVA